MNQLGSGLDLADYARTSPAACLVMHQNEVRLPDRTRLATFGFPDQKSKAQFDNGFRDPQFERLIPLEKVAQLCSSPCLSGDCTNSCPCTCDGSVPLCVELRLSLRIDVGVDGRREPCIGAYRKN